MIALQFLLAALLSQGSAAIQQSRPASIQGFVLRTGTAEAIAKARINLSLLGGSESQTTVSNGNGSFAFQTVPAGRYRLTVSRTGFLNKIYAKGGDDAANSVLTLTSGQILTDVKLLMTPASAISGRVYDPDGDPVPNVLMQALKYSYINDQLTLSVVNSAQ